MRQERVEKYLSGKNKLLRIIKYLVMLNNATVLQYSREFSVMNDQYF